MTSQGNHWPWVYEVSVQALKEYWISLREKHPHLRKELDFFIDLTPVLENVWEKLTQKSYSPGRHPKSRPSQFFFTLSSLFFK